MAIALGVAALVEVDLAVAQAHGDTTYAAYARRTIKALPDADVERLLAGEGMGFALAAELNGYPGPKHVLELSDSLELTQEQRRAIDTIRSAMLEQARDVGSELVEAERRLDRAFAQRMVTETELDGLTQRIGMLSGRLRATHLRAHLAVTRLLTPHQIATYARLRGYGGGHVH
jgi:hypothetical protein